MLKPIKDHDCVKCGYCCTVRACIYGKWDQEKEKCIFLLDDKSCSKYHEISELELKNNVLYPMFGCGCSSTMFNTVREEKIMRLS